MAPLIAALIAAGQFTADPQQFVLGRADAGSELAVRASAGAKVSITASVGSVEEVRREGSLFLAHYRPPKVNTPAVALLLAQVEEGGERQLRWLALALSGSDTMEIETRPGAYIAVEVAGRTFGPVEANEKGIAALRLVVPPGVSKGTLRISDNAGNSNQKPLDLEPPPFSRLRIAARGEWASAASPLELEIFAVRPDGSPDDGARIEISAPVGEAEVLERIDHGVYLARYLPPPATSSGTVRVEAKAGGQVVSLQVPVRPAEARAAQWASSFSLQRPWSVSLGLLGGGGATWDGATAGTILVEGALRLGTVPAEALLEIGPGFFSSTSTGRQPLAILVQLGLRAHHELVHGLDGHATVLAGIEQQSLSAGGGAVSQNGWGPRIGLALGVNLRLGPGRVLAQMQLDSSPSQLPGMKGLGGTQMLAGYLLTVR
jgi:hypothetical protein